MLPARTILVAAGTQPNTVLAREDPEHFELDGRYFQACDEDGEPVKPERDAKPAEAQVLMRARADGRAMSFFGDLHPSFAGNVVKAMGERQAGLSGGEPHAGARARRATHAETRAVPRSAERRAARHGARGRSA